MLLFKTVVDGCPMMALGGCKNTTTETTEGQPRTMRGGGMAS